MSSGNINVIFDTPDLSITGTGELNISDYISEMFYKNPDLLYTIKNKISDIFDKIDTNLISKNYEKKLKEAFQIDKKPIDLQNIFKKQVIDTLKKLNIKSEDIIPKGEVTPKSNIKENITSSTLTTLENRFSLFVKDLFKKNDMNFPSLYTINQNLIKILKKNDKTDIIPNGESYVDTIFKQSIDVNIVGVSHEVLHKLAKVFDFTNKQIDFSTKKEEQGNLLENLFTGKGLAALIGTELTALAIAGILKRLLPKGIPTPALSTLTGIALLSGAILWTAVDGIRGWLAAKEWGVDPIAAAIGGALGGMGSGVEGAIKNAGKGALWGGGIGILIGGPIGLIVGSLVGIAIGGILGWIGGKNISIGIDTIVKKINTNFMQAIGMFGIGENDPTRGIRKFIMVDIPLWFTSKLPSILSHSFYKLATIFERFGMEKASEATLRIGTKAVGSTILKRILKFIPIVGCLISLGEAFDRFKNGNISGGLIALAAGIAYNVPFLGTGIGIALDAINMGLDIKYGGDKGRATSGFNNLWKKTIMPFLRNLPLVGTLMVFGEALGAFSTGDWKEGLRLLGEAGVITFGGGIFESIGGPNAAKVFENVNNGFIQFGEALGEGISNILDWFIEKWNNIKTWVKDKWDSSIKSVRNTFENLIEFIGNLGQNIKDMIISLTPEWIKKHFNNNESSTQKPIKTQAAIIDKKSQNIILQPDKQDKLYTTGNTDIFAKPDDILGKTFTNINKHLKLLTELSTKLNNNVLEQNNIIKVHTEIFKNILKVNDDQLHMLPNLIPPPQQTQQSPMVNTNTRDSIFDYRAKVLGHTLRG